MFVHNNSKHGRRAKRLDPSDGECEGVNQSHFFIYNFSFTYPIQSFIHSQSGSFGFCKNRISTSDATVSEAVLPMVTVDFVCPLVLV